MTSADSADDDLAYLRPGFDPSSLTVPRLRNVLLTHGVRFPSGAKKADLVETFNAGLKPKAKTILSQQRRIQRTSYGIEDAVSSIASTQDDDEEESPSVAQTPAAKRGRGRPKKVAQPSIEEDDTVIPPASTRRRMPSAKSKENLQNPSRERSRSKPSRERRRSTVTPAIKAEEPEPTTWTTYTKDSPFSRDNPFQSGSSPPTADKSSRRKTDGPQQEEESRKSTGRRKTDNAGTASRKSIVDVPIHRSYGQRYDHDGIDAGEEFVPEEEATLAVERREGRDAVVPVRRRRQGGTSNLTRGLLSVLFVLGASVGGLWREEKLNVGFCGVGQPSDKIHGVELPEWADGFRPRCEPTLAHAKCYDQLQVECDKGFVLKQHPLALWGLLPFPPTCEPDSVKAQQVKRVVNAAVEELRIASAEAACGERVGSEVLLERLEATLRPKIAKKLPPDEVDALLAQAIEDAQERSEVIAGVDENGQRTLKSTSLARVGLVCSSRRWVRLTLERYLRFVILAVSTLLALLAAAWRIQDNRRTQDEAKILASSVFHSLADHAAAVAYDSPARDGYLSVYQLRDDVLRSEFSASRRKKLWSRVEALVEQNSNVRARLGTLDTGDVGRGWKWIGAVRALEDGGSRAGSRRGSARFSLPSAADLGSSPMAELGLESNGSPSVEEESSFRRWEDSGRPQF